MLEAAVLSLVADKLIGRFGGRILGKNPLETALAKLGDLNVFKGLIPGGSLSVDDVTDGLIDKLVGSVTDFQKIFDLAPDGLLGQKTLDLLNTLVKCKDPHGPPANAPRVTPQGDKVIRVWVDDLPNLVDGGDAREIFDRCWRSWQEHCQLEYLEATSAENSEVVVSVGQVDGAGGAKLAEANVGPPDGVQLTMVIDKDERFALNPGQQVPVFEAMCIHEIGHLLGLSHTVEAEFGGGTADLGTVMYPVHQPTVLKPQAQDIERIQKRWGKPIRSDLL